MRLYEREGDRIVFKGIPALIAMPGILVFYGLLISAFVVAAVLVTAARWIGAGIGVVGVAAYRMGKRS